jgi:hypothetical protein
VLLPETEIENVWHKHCATLLLFISYFFFIVTVSAFMFPLSVRQFFHFLFEFNYPVDQSNDAKKDIYLFTSDYLKFNCICSVT